MRLDGFKRWIGRGGKQKVPAVVGSRNTTVQF